MGRPRAGETDLTRDVIIDAAIERLHAEGIEALSLSRIAAALNVKTPAIYWYFSSKADVYTSVSERLFRQVLDSIDPALDGRPLLWAIGRALRDQQCAIRDAARLISMAGVSEDVRDVLVPALLARVARNGISCDQARTYLTAIQALTLGWSIFELNPATNRVMRESGAGDLAYREALRRLIFGEVPGEAEK